MLIKQILTFQLSFNRVTKNDILSKSEVLRLEKPTYKRITFIRGSSLSKDDYQ